MLHSKRPLGTVGSLVLLVGIASIGCGGSDDASTTAPGARRSMAQSAAPKAAPPRTEATQAQRSNPSRSIPEEIDLVATEPAREAVLGETIRLHVEVAGRLALENELSIAWLVNDDPLENERGMDLDTRSLSPGDIVVAQAAAGKARGRSRPVSSMPIRIRRAAPPQILSQPSAEMIEGQYRYQLKAESPIERAALEYSLIEGPEGMTIDGKTGLVTWHPAKDQLGRFKVDIAVVDPWGAGAAQSFSIDVATDSHAPPASPR